MKQWFVTGASRGLGLEIATAALRDGDRVIGTSRAVAHLEPLRSEFGAAFTPMRLDVTDTGSIEPVFADAVRLAGRIDVVVNNAGYVEVGALEETAQDEARRELETLFFGPLWVTKAAIAHMRPAGGGDIVQLSSLAGVGGLPGHSAYTAAKWALEGMVEAVRDEIAPFGIRLLLLEPAGFRTSLATGVRMSRPIPEYDAVMGPQRQRYLDGTFADAGGDPVLAARALVRLLKQKRLPHRLLLGAKGYEVALMLWQQRIDEAREWAEVSRSMGDRQH